MSRRYRPYVSSRSSGMSSTLEPSPRPQLRSHSPRPSGIDADMMAKQTVAYMNVLAEHSAAIKTYPQSESAYQRIINQGRVLPPGTKWPSLDHLGRDDLRRKMETIIHRQATSAEDHLEICCAAHTLLFLQHDILSRLPYAECRKIEEKTNQLRVARRQQFTRRQGRFRGLARPPPLPPVEKPSSQARSSQITSHLLDNLLDFSSQPVILDKIFRFSEPTSDVDVVYQIRSVEVSSGGLRFGLQTEGSRVADTISRDELEDLLEYSVVVMTDQV